MDAYAKEDYEPSRPQSATRLNNVSTPMHNVMESASNPYPPGTQGTPDNLNQTTTARGEVYDKVTEKVHDGHAKARHYILKNPTTLIFITLGVGLGVGLLLGANSHHHSPASRIVQTMVNAVSNIATGLFR